MTALAIFICVLCQLLLVSGQLLLKRGMNAREAVPVASGRVAANLAGGIALLTVWFFLWLGLLGRWELSHLFPFEGLNPAILAVGAWVFLKEHVTPTGWIGIVLVSLGVALVSAS